MPGIGTSRLRSQYGPNQYPGVPPGHPANDWYRRPYGTYWGTGRQPNQPVDPILRPLLTGATSLLSGTGTGTGTGVLPPRVAPPATADRRAAEDAAFGRAKDRIGQATQGLMRAIRGQVGARNIGGSSIEGNMISDALGQAYGQTGEVIRDQAIEGLRRDQTVEDRDYAGELTQRGQDIPVLQGNRDQAFRILQMLLRY